MTTQADSREVVILLVEDDPADVQLIREGLRDGVRHRLSVVKDGVEALAYLHREADYAQSPLPDLILLDLQMPKKGGLEVLAEIKTDTRLRRIPVIVLTTSDAPDDIFRSYDLQASLFITKPSDLDEFERVMKMIREFCLMVVKLPPRE